MFQTDAKTVPKEEKTSKSETSSGESPAPQAAPGGFPFPAGAGGMPFPFPEAGGAGPNPFDFSAMTGLLNVCYIF